MCGQRRRRNLWWLMGCDKFDIEICLQLPCGNLIKRRQNEGISWGQRNWYETKTKINSSKNPNCGHSSLWYHPCGDVHSDSHLRKKDVFIYVINHIKIARCQSVIFSSPSLDSNWHWISEALKSCECSCFTVFLEKFDVECVLTKCFMEVSRQRNIEENPQRVEMYENSEFISETLESFQWFTRV